MVTSLTAITLILLCSAAESVAHSSRSIVARASAAYQNEDFEIAKKEYASLSSKGPGVWFNLGNCEYELGNYPEAIIAWKRAQGGASCNLLHRIDTQIIDAYEKAGVAYKQSATFSFLDWGVRCIHPFFLQFLFLLCWYLLWILIITPRQIPFKTIYYVILGVLIACSGLFLMRYYTLNVYRSALVVKRGQLLVGPHEQYDALNELSLLQDVQIREERPGWYKVATNDQMGWVMADSIETI